MGSFYWRVVSSPLFSGALKRSSSPIANTSQRAKRRKTSHRGAAEDQHLTHTEVREERENPSDSFSCHQVFLSHSGHQKSFVEQLFLDLQRENISCFFDKDPQSLPKGEDFPPRIFEAAQKCRVGVVVLSDEFISSKWPMLELCAFVRAKQSTNRKFKILPLFLRLSPESLWRKLQQKDSLKRSWQQLLKNQKRAINLDEWVDALASLRSVNGEVYSKQESEENYRAKIVSSIRGLLSPKLPYDESDVQGRERICKEVARLFHSTQCVRDGVKIAGLYGVGGIGKTTLARLACNFYSDDFDGRVFHVELGNGMPLERLKRALKILTRALEVRVNSITDIEEGWCVFNQLMMGSGRVFLAIDNVSDLDESINEAQRYLRAVLSAGNQSMILLTSRSSSILRRLIPKGKGRCTSVPSLTEEEAIAILLQRTPFTVCNLSAEEQNILKRCAMKCCFSWHGTLFNLPCSAYHPLALRVFGALLYDSCDDLSEWINIQNSSEPWRSGQENLFSTFEESFKRLSEEHKKIFMFLCLYLPESHMLSEDAFNWLAIACDIKVEHINYAIVELKRKGFVENMDGWNRQPYIHDLHIEFAANKADGTGEWVSLKGRLDIPACLQKNDRLPFLAMKFDNCHFQCPGFVNVELFRNVVVLHLQDMPQLKILNLSAIRIVRSITIIGCAGLQEICGLGSLTSLVYFVIKGCSANVQFSGMEGLVALQHLQLDANLSETITESSLLAWTSFPPLQNASFVEHVQKSTGWLDLRACSKLQTIKLTLEGMHNLKELPTLAGLTALQRLTLEGMHNLKELPTLTASTSLEYLVLKGMHSLQEPPTLAGLTSLQELRLDGMHSLKELRPLAGLTSLRRLWLEEMHSLKELPTLAGLTSLEYLALQAMHSLRELPTLAGLTSLKVLSLKGMPSLRELPTLAGLTSLQMLSLEEMHNLRELPTLAGLTSLQELWSEGMHSLKELPTLAGLTSLRALWLRGMRSLKELPTLAGLTSLRGLWLERMRSLRELPTLAGLDSLRGISLGRMHSFKEIPTLAGLPSLEELRLEGMHRFKELPTLAGLTSLRGLWLEGMHGLRELPTLAGLTSLRTLWLEGMHGLRELPTLAGLTSLQELHLEGMHSLKELPTLAGLTSLQELRLEGMHRLKDLPTLTGLTCKPLPSGGVKWAK